MFLSRRQQADVPNHCSSSNRAIVALLWYCCTCKCPSGASQFVTLLAAPPRSSRQLLCPSATFRSALLHYASLYHVRCFSFAPGMAACAYHKTKSLLLHIFFRKHTHNTHWVPLRSISVGFTSSRLQSTRCQQFCSPALPSRLRLASICKGLLPASASPTEC